MTALVLEDDVERTGWMAAFAAALTCGDGGLIPSGIADKTIEEARRRTKPTASATDHGSPGFHADVETSVIHELKCWPEYFIPLADGRKRFEFRKNDRHFHVGDVLRLREYRPGSDYSGPPGYTGRETVVRVTYLLDQSRFGDVPDGFVIMSVENVTLHGTVFK